MVANSELPTGDQKLESDPNSSQVHVPITLAFGVLAVAHILAIFLFWCWK